EANKAIVRRLYEAFRSGNAAALDDLLTDDFINHNPQTTGLAAVKALFAQAGLIDAEVYSMIAAGDLVAVHAHYNSPAQTAAIDLFKIRSGQIAEHWDVLQRSPEQ